MKRRSLRKLRPWLGVAVVSAFSFNHLKLGPNPVIAHTITPGEVRGEVMGTSPLEARIKTILSPRNQEITAVLANTDSAVTSDSHGASQLQARC